MPTPTDFLSDPSLPRTIGMEMEYEDDLLLAVLKENRIHRLAKRIGLIAAGPTTNVFLDNGARLYKDTHHPEYAAPESEGPDEAGFTDHAGIDVVAMLNKFARPALAGNSKIINSMSQPFLHALRRTGTYSHSERKAVTKGYHGNYATPAPSAQRLHVLRKVLGTHFAARQILFGGGFVSHRYAMSQKASGIGEGVVTECKHHLTDGKKPMGAIREKASDKIELGWTLVEDRSPDALMFPHLTILDIASVSLILRLVEQQVIHENNVDEYSFEDPVSVMHRLKDDMYGYQSTQYATIAGTAMSALSAEARLATTAAEFSKSNKLPADEERSAGNWLELCETLAQKNVSNNAFEALVGETEWATKYHLLRAKINGEPIGSNSRAVAFDRQWTSVDETSIGKLAAKKFAPQTEALNEASEKYIFNPPANTRASIRAEHIRRNDVVYIDWGRVKHGSSDTTELLANPHHLPSAA